MWPVKRSAHVSALDWEGSWAAALSLNHHRNLGVKGLPPTPCTEEETEVQRRPKTDPQQQRKSRESSTPAPRALITACPPTAPRGWLLPKGDERRWTEGTGNGGPTAFSPSSYPAAPHQEPLSRAAPSMAWSENTLEHWRGPWGLAPPTPHSLPSHSPRSAL